MSAQTGLNFLVKGFIYFINIFKKFYFQLFYEAFRFFCSRGSWRPIGHMRPSSPLLDSVRDQFEGYDQLAKDFSKVFLNMEPPTMLFDVSFLVGQGKQKQKLYGVRAILGVRSRFPPRFFFNFSPSALS